MGRITLYSSSRRSRPGVDRAQFKPAQRIAAFAAPEPARPAVGAHRPSGRWLTLVRRMQKPLLAAAGAGVVLALVYAYAAIKPVAHTFTQTDIDAAVLHTLETKTLPSTAARAYEVIAPSVVRVRQLAASADGERDVERSVGSGVVIVDKGIILTNLHVVAGGDRLSVTFADGTESEATVIGVQPENDLAVIQAK